MTKDKCYNQCPSASCSRNRLLNISSDFIIRFSSPPLNNVSNQWRSQEASDQWNPIQARTHGTHSVPPAFSVFNGLAIILLSAQTTNYTFYFIYQKWLALD